jgi:hypothetical protein
MKRIVFFAAAIAAIALVFVPRTRSAGQVPDDVLQEAKRKSEEYRQQAERIDVLAGAIHSEEDARAFVDEMGKAFAEELPYDLTAPLRARVAKAEYAAVTDGSKLIPEQRVVEAWNRWVTDINAPAEARMTVAEFHLLRENRRLSSTDTWSHEYRSLWNLSNIYALKPNGRVADSCRPVEALLLLHQIDSMFQNVIYARDFIASGKTIDAVLQKRAEAQKSGARPTARIVFTSFSQQNPVISQLRRAEEDYFEKHGYIGTSDRVLQLVSEILRDE